jgi:glycerophosphoryl diester phosphodiesterase
MSKKKVPQLAYHRGRHGILPDGRVIKENSLLSFEAALKEGAEIIEFDVEKGLRICHDPNIPPDAPYLAEVLNLVAGKCSLNVEIKCPSTINEVCNLINKSLVSGLWKPEQFIVSSFHHSVAIECRERLPSVKVGAIFDGVILPEYVATLASNGINNLHVEWRAALMDFAFGAKMRDAAKEFAMPIWAYTVNQTSDLDRLIEYGVDAVFTDQPIVLKKHLERLTS